MLRGKSSNYDTDVFTPLLAAIGQIVGKQYGGKLDDLDDIAFRVIADHLRMLTFAITDGGMPSNKGRGSVIRSVLRRAVRFGYQRFGQREPFIWKLVPALVEHMGGAFPELKTNPGRVQDVVRGEEADFLRTIEHGLSRFAHALVDAVTLQICIRYGYTGLVGRTANFVAEKVPSYASTWALRLQDRQRNPVELEFPPVRETARVRQFIYLHCAAPPVIPAEAVFNLHTTDGFPPDLTKQMAEEAGAAVDIEGYLKLMQEHGEKSRGKATTAQVALNVSGGLPNADDRPKWSGSSCDGRVLGWIAENQFQTTRQIPADTEVGLLLDRTCFYAEQGGQVGDTGTIRTPTGLFEVSQTVKVGNAVVHVGSVTAGRLEIGQTAALNVNSEREFTRKNHTATHLLHWALHRVLGEHVEQRGSKVKPDEFTFDFSHTGPMSDSEKAEVERLINEKVYADLSVQVRELPQAEAKKLPGVKAFFGDKYGETVRVIEIGDGFSREFCGGTHLEHTGQIGFFKIIGEEAVGKGVRRLTCVTAREAVKAVQAEDHVLAELTDRFRCRPSELPAKVDALQEEIKQLAAAAQEGGGD